MRMPSACVPCYDRIMPKPEQPTRLSRLQHERILTIFRLIQGGRFPNCTILATEAEATRRTILRDIAYLRDRMRLPIAFDSQKKGYYFTKPVENMPLLEMRGSDLLWLFLGQHLLQHAATPELADKIRASFQRISALFGSKVSVCWNQLSGIISSKVTGIGEADSRTFGTISKGLSQGVEIRFEYRKTPNSAPENRRVRPVHSAFVNGQWYLFAQDTGKNAIRTFVFSRMSKVTVTDTKFNPQDMPDIPSLVRSGFGVLYSQVKPKLVELRVDREIAHIISERTWHPSQTITSRTDGGLTLRLKISSFLELTNWICSWGPLMEVLEPPELRAKVAKTLRAAAGVYDPTEVR